jgi:hypothetical protein
VERLNYTEAIEKILNSFCDMVVREGTEVKIIRDRESGNYLVILAGWNDGSRVYGISVHIELKNDKIWIHQDRTDTGIAQELVEFGVPKTDIVLAFKSPFTRKFTEYAVN